MANNYSESTLTPAEDLHHHRSDSSQLEQKLWGHLPRSRGLYWCPVAHVCTWPWTNAANSWSCVYQFLQVQKRIISPQGSSLLRKLSLVKFPACIFIFGIMLSCNFFFHPNLQALSWKGAFMMLKLYIVKFAEYFINLKKQYINDMQAKRNSGRRHIHPSPLPNTVLQEAA